MNFIEDYSNLLNPGQACRIAEAEYIKNPRDVDNLTRWAGAMIKLYKNFNHNYELEDSILKLEEALFLDPYHHEALWCLGQAFSIRATECCDDNSLLYYTKKEIASNQRAFELDPSNETYRIWLESSREALEEIFGSDLLSTGLTKVNDCEECQIAEAEYINNPRDADNLTRWGGALLNMHNNLGPDEDLTIYDAILKLEEALFLEPYHHEALWYLGHAFGAMATKYNEESEMDYYAKKAARCYQRAFELDSSNEIYRKSFELHSKDLQHFAPDQRSTRITESSPSSITKGIYALHLESTGKAEPSPSGIKDIKKDFASEEQLTGITESYPCFGTKAMYALPQQSTMKVEPSPSGTKTQKEKDNLKYDMLNGKITKLKKSKTSLSENQELLDELKKMRENQEKTNLIMENMMSFIQNRFSGEDVNAFIQASRQVPEAFSAPNQTNFPSPNTNEHGQVQD